MDPRLLVVFAGLAGAASLQGTIGESNAERRANDFRYTPDPRVMRVVAGAHRSTLADALWLRALPDMARSFADRALKKRWIASATDVVTDLEPSFGTVYGYGAAHLDLVDRDPDAAIALLEKGIAKNPGDAGLHVALAMVFHMAKKDRAKTLEHLEIASTLPGCDSLSIAMLAAMKVEGGEDFVALYTWARTLEDAPNRKIRVLSEYELYRVKALIAARALREYEKTHGRPAAAPDDLREPGLIDPSVVDVVLAGLALDARGRPRYARMEGVDVDRTLYLAVDWIAGFREGEGRLPTEEELLRDFGRLPQPPAGKRWRYADGKLQLVDVR